MSNETDVEMLEDPTEAIAERLGAALRERGATIGIAESLTGGLLVQALARVSGSGEWLQGAVVAYASSVKHDLLAVSADKVVSQVAAEEMARAARERLGADVAVAVTGAAGPDRQDGERPGTVWIGVDDGRTVGAKLFETGGSPEEVCHETVVEALRCILARLEG
jgi:nicotinamide-nucleotide amidase